MTAAAFTFASSEVIATLPGALYIPAEETMVVVDLYREKASSLARRGSLLPPYDSRATLVELARTIHYLGPRRVICLGDSFHDDQACERLAVEDANSLRRLIAACQWIWIVGNHDPALTANLGGCIEREIRMGSLTFRHQALAGSVYGEVSGHFHPKASVRVAGTRLTGRCFVSDGRRLILPSFGTFTGGLDVFNTAIRSLLAPTFTVHLLGRMRIHRFPSARLTGPNVS